MEASPHIIEKMVLEINTGNEKTGNYLKNNIDKFLKQTLLQKLEDIFIKYDRTDTITRFQELNIGLNVEDWGNPNQIQFEILKKIENYLRETISEKDSVGGEVNISSFPIGENRQNLSIEKNEAEIFLHFLKKGFLPWYGSKEQIEAFQKKGKWQKWFSNPDYVDIVKELFVADDTVFVRFLYQFPIDMVIAFLTKINSRVAESGDHTVKLFKKLEPGFRLELLHTLFWISLVKQNDKLIGEIQYGLKLLQENRGALENTGDGFISDLGQVLLHVTPDNLLSHNKFQDIYNEIQFLISNDRLPQKDDAVSSKEKAKSDLTKEIRRQKEKNRDYSADKTTEIAVQNAGLILLHPFLRHFFSAVQIIDKQGDILPTKHELAVQTLHFLATGSEDFFEGDLVLAKFLCGIPFNTPIHRKRKLPSKIKKESEAMLSEVIKNWPALKNTSQEGLRQMFLQRNGKLIRNDINSRLLIERKAQDILLEKLNWNISIIKLKWITGLLFVDW